jgi:hypothetical protein
MGNGDIDSGIIDLLTSWKWVIGFTLLALYLRGKNIPYPSYIDDWVGPRIGLDDTEKRKILPLPGLEFRQLGRPARIQPLYRLIYWSSHFMALKVKYFLLTLFPTIGIIRSRTQTMEFSFFCPHALISHADSLYTQLWQGAALYCDLKNACITLDGNLTARIDRDYGRPPYVSNLFTWGDTALNIHDTIITPSNLATF